jgi:hypothetical protein
MAALCALASGLCLPSVAGAVETRADVQTDHVDPIDDGGPRRVAFWLRPGATIGGWLGAEVDVACSDHVAVTAEGNARAWGLAGYRVVLGLSVYPQAYAFHRLYIHPLVEWVHESSPTAEATAIGAGATAGVALTAPFGGALRAGLGLEYARATGSATPSASVEGVGLLLDADVGWVF